MIKVLILNGSTPATIQVLDILNPEKFEITVCDPNSLCWARFHKHCRKFIKFPKLNDSPQIFLEFLLDQLQKEKYDVILPVHEEGLLIATHYREISKYTKVLIGSARYFHTIMNKRLFLELVQLLNLPVPKTKIVKSIDEVTRANIFPCWVKLPYGTSSTRVVRVVSKDEAFANLAKFSNENEFIIQEEIVGEQCTIQAIFENGKLMASHQYLALAKGFGGGASRRISIDEPDLKVATEEIGKKLNWSGPLMIDFIREKSSRTAYIIEGNPRIGETYNAFLSGQNLPETIIKLSLGEKVSEKLISQTETKSHQMFTEVTGSVKYGESLWQRYSKALQAIFCFGEYQNSVDEFFHPSVDPVSFLLTVGIFISLPFLSKKTIEVENNKSAASLSSNTVKQILKND